MTCLGYTALPLDQNLSLEARSRPKRLALVYVRILYLTGQGRPQFVGLVESTRSRSSTKQNNKCVSYHMKG